jgi:protein import protein ZIM17
MSKHGYHKGTVLIACPSCKNRHIIADHLGIFLDDKTTLEDILAKQGANVTKGHIEGDMEFWEDGSVYKTGISQEESSEASTKESS